MNWLAAQQWSISSAVNRGRANVSSAMVSLGRCFYSEAKEIFKLLMQV